MGGFVANSDAVGVGFGVGAGVSVDAACVFVINIAIVQ